MDGMQERFRLALPSVLALAAVVAGGCSGDSASAPEFGGTPNVRPVAAFTADVLEGDAPLEVNFDGRTSSDPDGEIVRWAWTFGDGATGSGQTVTHVYEQPGSYTPSLTVTDDRGASHTQNGDAITVDSPPGKGENEIWGVVWHDADADGERGAEEQPIPAFAVFLDEDGDGFRDSTEVTALTNDEGEYRFEGLDGRRPYTVTQEMTLGWTNTAPGLSAGGHGPRKALPIIGGEAAESGEFPFQMALVPAGVRFVMCGATSIAANWALTAAHCVDGGVQPESIQLLAGTNDVTSGGEFIDVVRILVHPAYATTAISNDIALLELADHDLYPRIELLAPTRAELAAPGTMGTTIGWGLTSEGGQGSAVLKKLEAEIISNDECKTHLDTAILDVTICAGKLGSSESTCNGDSGGPLMVPYRGRWLQAGIVSFGSQICYQPTAFARVSALIEFPLSNIPPEASGAVVVDWSDGETTAEASFGNYR